MMPIFTKIYMPRKLTRKGTKPQLYKRGFELIQMYFANCIESKVQNQYLRDKCWDDAVDVLLGCVKHYKYDGSPNGSFEGFLYYCLVRRWGNQLNYPKWKYRFYCLYNKSFDSSEYFDSEREKEKDALSIEDNEQEKIDAKDFVESLVEHLTEQQRNAVKLYIKYDDLMKVAKKMKRTRSRIGQLMTGAITKMRKVSELIQE